MIMRGRTSILIPIELEDSTLITRVLAKELTHALRTHVSPEALLNDVTEAS